MLHDAVSTHVHVNPCSRRSPATAMTPIFQSLLAGLYACKDCFLCDSAWQLERTGFYYLPPSLLRCSLLRGGNARMASAVAIYESGARGGKAHWRTLPVTRSSCRSHQMAGACNTDGAPHSRGRLTRPPKRIEWDLSLMSHFRCVRGITLSRFIIHGPDRVSAGVARVQ